MIDPEKRASSLAWKVNVVAVLVAGGAVGVATVSGYDDNRDLAGALLLSGMVVANYFVVVSAFRPSWKRAVASLITVIPVSIAGLTFFHQGVFDMASVWVLFLGSIGGDVGDDVLRRQDIEQNELDAAVATPVMTGRPTVSRTALPHVAEAVPEMPSTVLALFPERGNRDVIVVAAFAPKPAQTHIHRANDGWTPIDDWATADLLSELAGADFTHVRIGNRGPEAIVHEIEITTLTGQLSPIAREDQLKPEPTTK